MKRVIELFDESHNIKINELDLITAMQDAIFEETLCVEYLVAFEKWYYTSEDKNGLTVLNLVCNSHITRDSIKAMADEILDRRISLLRRTFTEASVKCGVAHTSIINGQQAYNNFVDKTGVDLRQFLDNIHKTGMIEKDSYIDWCLEHQDYDEGDSETVQGRWYAEQCMAYESALDHDFNTMLDCVGHMVTEVLSLFTAVVIQNCYVLSENMFYRQILTDAAMGCLLKLKGEMSARLTLEGGTMLDMYMRREFVAHFMAFNFIDYEQQLLHNYDGRIRIKMSDVF